MARPICPGPRTRFEKSWPSCGGGDAEILALAERSVLEHFIYGHIPNVTILAVRVGFGADLGEEDLVTLGLCAFLHDVGLSAHMELAAKATRLTDEEYKTLKAHVGEGQKILDYFSLPEGDIKATVHRVIGESHERTDGRGYPQKLEGDKIHPFAKIIHMVDIYETLSHGRPWRARVLPHEVLRRMVEDAPGVYDGTLLRLLVDALSFYPPGTYVRLNSGEIGRVLAVNPGQPLRPKVWVVIDENGARRDSPVRVNLAARPVLYVTEAVDETKIDTDDARLRLELRAQRWWMKSR
jgi:HD-GYP domain-containing protein (c-di-GMP phosphodiesterase class II)